MAKTNIELKQEKLNKLYVERSVNKDESLTPEIDRLKKYLDRYYYGAK